jgi:hypothetical protein
MRRYKISSTSSSQANQQETGHCCRACWDLQELLTKQQQQQLAGHSKNNSTNSSSSS